MSGFSLQDLKAKWQQVQDSNPQRAEELKAERAREATQPQKQKKKAVVVPNANRATAEQLQALARFSSRGKATGSHPIGKPEVKKATAKASQPLTATQNKPSENVRATSVTKPAPKAAKTTRLDKHPQPVQKPSVAPEKPKQAKEPARQKPQAVQPEADNGFRNQPKKLELVESLPVSQWADEIKAAIQNNQVVIVCGETGSGKTTQLPKICLQLGLGQKGLIGHTQPRRIAATSIAKRISEEMEVPLGEVAGYKIRFNDKMEPGASIKLMTDGILLAETQTDPLLKRYDTIIIDEAHERSLNIDFLLGYLRQILPRRKDLKVIITSATIDSERFAKHFEAVNKKPVPVINVSGRLYPVQIRYRPVQDEDENDDRTLMEAVVDACDELMQAGGGDILVFLPGEREIREATDALGRHGRPGVEILPLFSRLTIEEQDRIFHSGAGRRIVLSTNIAETSLTVPGIRYVVDSGLARLKRYSYRNKVEQLQVEPISQAAAKQRAGRSGRVANGIAIRLYDEADFAKRSEYTDPEILRSSLATVILKMKSLHLSDVREFPFVQAPLPRAITDGYDLLIELNAVTAREGELTEIGRQLAKLPVDAKVARMLQAAHENQALAEVLIIAAAISVQDPRERPLEAQQQADQAHKKFADDRSDFLSYVKLWNYVQNLIENKESNRLLEKQLKADYLSARRLREWRDVHRQLKEMVTELGWRINTVEATYEQLHKSLLAGLLGNIGTKVLDADWKTPPFVGARGIKYWIWPGSPMVKKAGKWIMSAEIVETSKLFARTVATIEPEWLETVGKHLIKKSWSDPHWEKTAGHVVAFEKGTLYGLPVYTQRRVNFASKDPKLAREIFIRQALVEGQFDSQAPFWQHNQALIRDIIEMEHKSRRPDVLVDDNQIFDFYDRLLGEEVCSEATLEKWRRVHEAKQPKLLYLTREALMQHSASGVTIEYFPKKIEVAGIPMALSYNFDPGSPRDGLTLTVPLFALNQIDEVQMEWLVPGMIKEKTWSLIKTLPVRFRSKFGNAQDWAKAFAMRHEVPQGDYIATIIADAKDQFAIDIKRTDFKQENIPAHLHMNYKVVDEHGRQLGMSRSLPQLRSELGVEARRIFQTIASQDAQVAEDLQEEITTWSFGELPDVMEIRRKGLSLIGHPALVDQGDFCSLEVFDDPEQALALHKKGLRRLIRLQLKEQIKYLDKSLNSLQSAQIICSSLTFAKQAFGSLEELKTEVVDTTIDEIALSADLPTSEESFARVCSEVKDKILLLANEHARLIGQIAAEAQAVNQKLNLCKNNKSVQDDIQNQLTALFEKHFIEKRAKTNLKHYPRYLKAVQVRLDDLKKDPARDEKRMQEVQALTIPYKRELIARKGVSDPLLEEFGIYLDELRVSLFAQHLRTPMPVSVKRLNKMWEKLIASSY